MLKDFYGNPKSDFKDIQLCYVRSQSLYERIKNSFPEGINATLSINIDLGKDCIRAFIRLEENVTEDKTRIATYWLKDEFNVKVERFFRKNEGKFAWQSPSIKINDYEIIVFIENAHKGKCEIKKVKKEIEVYETNCK